MNKQELIEKIESIINDWFKSGNENQTYLAYLISEYLQYHQPETKTAHDLIVEKFSNKSDEWKDIVVCRMFKYDEVVELMQEYAQQLPSDEESRLKKENEKLRFMIDNSLGWEDMRNDITYPHEL